MLPSLYWLAGDRVRDKIDEGLSALRSITEASTISFVDTKEVELQHGHLARMQDELERAMEDERYVEAERIKGEIKVMLLPSQQSQRAIEDLQVHEMAQQLQRSISRNDSMLTKLAKQSWKRSVANCDTLQFAPTTPEKFNRAIPPANVARVNKANNVKEANDTCGIRSVGSPVEGSLDQVMQELHFCLANKPPAVARAAECALHLIALVGDSEGLQGDAELEIADSCIAKVAQVARTEIDAIANGKDGELYFPPNPLWQQQYHKALSMCLVCQELEAEDAGWDSLADLTQR